MIDINIDDLKSHIGTMVEDEDVATGAPLREMIVTFDRRRHAARSGRPDPSRLARLLFSAAVTPRNAWGRWSADRHGRAA